MDIVCCPGCGQPAEVVWRRHLSSTDGAIEHVSLRCLIGHVFLMPTAGLTSDYGQFRVEDAPSHELQNAADRGVRGGEPVRRQAR